MMAGQRKGGVIKCQNCGNDSHCGTVGTRTEKSWRGDILGEIVVCKSCRCENCILSNFSNEGC